MKRFWVSGSCIVIATVITWFVASKWSNQNAAVKKTAGAMRSAGEAISNARMRHAFVYAPQLFNESEKIYQAAMERWRSENERWFFSRNFDEVIKLSNAATSKVNIAIQKAGEYRDKFQRDFEGLVLEISGKISDFESYYTFLPLPGEVRSKYVKGKMLYSESRRAGEKGVFQEAYKKAVSAEALIKPAYEFGKNKLSNYFKLFPKWEQLNKEALKLSRSRKVIMVDKIARECYVYNNGKITHTFTAELGKNWVGTKNQQGDLTTPEGKYEIVRTLKGAQTIYYKSLLINYPNEEDKVRFTANKSSGVIPRTAKIGSLIMIHGGGGRGIDWTQGCVALTNSDMDKLFPLVGVGTPVFIVGSLVSLEKLKTRDSLLSHGEE